MKIIRWWGLAAFLGLILLMTLAWYLLAPFLIKSSIEDLGSEILGAKVEVASVDLTLFPLSVSLNRLVATDPGQPMQNLFDSEKVTFGIDTNSLLWKKIVIEELNLSGIKTATQRQTSGALAGGRKSTQTAQKVIAEVMPDMSNVNVKQLVEDADLITLKRINELKLSQSQMQDYWKDALDKTAFEKRLEFINSEYARLSKRLKENKLNLLKDKKEWAELKKSIDAERKQIAELSTKLAEDKKRLGDLLSAVKSGPGDDKKAIMDKLGVSHGVEGLVDKYIGPQYTPWVTKVVEMIKEFKPKNGAPTEEKQVIQVGKKVYFKDEHIFPEFLIKKIILSGQGGSANQQWLLDGKGFDLGYLPWLTGKPAKLNINFDSASAANDKTNAKANGKGQLTLSSDWKSANQMLSKLDTSVNNWPINSMPLMQTEAGNWTLVSGNLAAKIEAEVTLEKIAATAIFNIDAPKITVPEKISGWQKTLAESINNQSKIYFKLTASGDISAPNIKFDSDLEKLFKNAIGAKVKQEAEKLTEKVKQSISEKVGDISALERFNGNFDQWQSQISDKDSLLKGILDKIKI